MSWFLAVPNNGWIIRSIGSPHEIPTEWTVHSAGWHGARPLRIYTCTIRSRGCHLSWAEHAYINLYNLIHYVMIYLYAIVWVMEYYDTIYIYTYACISHTFIYIYICISKAEMALKWSRKQAEAKKALHFAKKMCSPFEGWWSPTTLAHRLGWSGKLP